MKKFLAFVMAASMALSLAACGGSTPASSTASTTTEATSEAAASTSGSKTDVAFVTDVGNIDDQSFNQYTWQGVQDFCSANSLNANYYRPTEDSDAARLEQMDNAVNDGAKSIVVAGYLFGKAIAEAQEKYPDVQFLALDVSTSDLGDKAPTANTALITYKEEQAGYLAGYAAVYDGYKELGFLGGMAVPAVIRYGYGFVQGADAAAKEIGATDVNIKYWYSGGFAATDEVKNKMDGWYSEGTEVVFACGGPVCQSCDAAAQANGGKMIGVDVDQSGQFDTVVTSAMKGLAESVQRGSDRCHEQRLEVQRDLLRQGDQARRCRELRRPAHGDQQVHQVHPGAVRFPVRLHRGRHPGHRRQLSTPMSSPRSPPSRLTTRADKALKV